MAEAHPPEPPRRKRDMLSVLGMVAVAGAAAFTSYSGLDGLAQLAGWPSRLALLLPVTVDAYAMTATRVWLSPARLTRKARAWARGNAIGAIATSVLGNTIFHAAAAHVLSVTWPVVVGISAIPSVVLGLTVHLWHVADDLEPEPKQSPGPAITEPETVRAAYPILGQPTDAPTGLTSGRPALPTGGTPTAKPVSDGGAAGKPKALPRGAAVRNAPANSAGTGGRGGVRSDEELLDEGRLIAAQQQRAPSANQLVTKLSIGPARARRIADQLAAEPIPSDAAQHTTPPQRPAAPAPQEPSAPSSPVPPVAPAPSEDQDPPPTADA